MELYEAIPDPEKLTTDADIELQLQEALISTHGYNTASFEPVAPNAQAVSEWEADYIAFEGLDDSGWNHDEDSIIDPGLF